MSPLRFHIDKQLNSKSNPYIGVPFQIRTIKCHYYKCHFMHYDAVGSANKGYILSMLLLWWRFQIVPSHRTKRTTMDTSIWALLCFLILLNKTVNSKKFSINQSIFDKATSTVYNTALMVSFALVLILGNHLGNWFTRVIIVLSMLCWHFALIE